MKKIIIFGSTGSIGRNALEVVRNSGPRFKVIGLCANRDTETLHRQIKEFRPAAVCVSEKRAAERLIKKLGRRSKVKVFKGEEGLFEFSRLRSDISLMAISGIYCLKPLWINLEYTQRVALANKESVVCAGSLVFKQAKKYRTQILPVDSEINALFQLINLNRRKKESEGSLHKVYLTASGGALAGYKKKDLARVKVKEVLSHPNWKMGQRITVDSATLVNKGFEVVEAHHFFGLPYKEIEILLHRESLVHALVEFADKSLLACLYQPDMKIPLTHSFYYPQRPVFSSEKTANCSLFSLKRSFSCTFNPVDYNRYPLLKIILAAARRQDNSLVVLNACDEVAVSYFLKEKIKFTDISRAMQYLFQSCPSAKVRSVDDVFYWDRWARAKTKDYLESQ